MTSESMEFIFFVLIALCKIHLHFNATFLFISQIIGTTNILFFISETIEQGQCIKRMIPTCLFKYTFRVE